jgi:hypothetical protein
VSEVPSSNGSGTEPSRESSAAAKASGAPAKQRKKSVMQHLFGGPGSDDEPRQRKKSVMQHLFGGSSHADPLEEHVSRHVQRSERKGDAAADLEARISRMESQRTSTHRGTQSERRRSSTVGGGSSLMGSARKSVVGLARGSLGEAASTMLTGRRPQNKWLTRRPSRTRSADSP